MKTIALILIGTMFSLQIMKAQTVPIIPKKLYDIWIKPDNLYQRTPRILFELKDSAIILSDSRRQRDILYRLGQEVGIIGKMFTGLKE